MSTILHATLARSFEELEALREAWNRLAAVHPRPEIFQTFAWVQAWWEAYQDQYRIFCPVIRDDAGQVAAIWPLALHGSQLRAIGHGASDHNDLLVASPAIAAPAFAAALRVLEQNRPHWSTAWIENVSEPGLLLPAARNSAAAAPLPIEIVAGGSGSATGASHFERFASQRDSLIENLERGGARVRFRHIEDREEIERHLPGLQRQHTQRLALLGIESQFQDPACRRHYDAMVEYLPPEALRFSVLDLDGVPIAYHLGFLHAGTYVWYKPVHDIDYAAFSPGELLLQSVFHYCAAAGVREFDFTLAGESYQSRFATVSYDYFQIHIFSGRSARQYLLRIREWLKARPAVFNRVKTAQARVSDFLGRLRTAARRDGIPRLARNRLGMLVGALLFRRDELLVFAFSGPGKTRLPPDLELHPFRLSALAEVTLDNPDYLDPERFELFRQRHAAGDRGVVALRNGKLAHVAWVGIRDSVSAGETGDRCVLPMDTKVSVIFDCWTPPAFRGQGIYPAVIGELARQESEAGRQPWIYCLIGNAASRAGIRKAGFVEQARFRRDLWFGRIDRSSVTRSR